MASRTFEQLGFLALLDAFIRAHGQGKNKCKNNHEFSNIGNTKY
jgi:hypothetical protein